MSIAGHGNGEFEVNVQKTSRLAGINLDSVELSNSNAKHLILKKYILILFT